MHIWHCVCLFLPHLLISCFPPPHLFWPFSVVPLSWSIIYKNTTHAHVKALPMIEKVSCISPLPHCMTKVWKSKDHSVELVISFHLCVGLGIKHRTEPSSPFSRASSSSISPFSVLYCVQEVRRSLYFNLLFKCYGSQHSITVTKCLSWPTRNRVGLLWSAVWRSQLMLLWL